MRVVDVQYTPRTDYDTHVHEDSYLCLVAAGEYIEWRGDAHPLRLVCGDDPVYAAGSRHAVRTGPAGCRIVHIAGGTVVHHTTASRLGLLWQIARSLRLRSDPDAADDLHIESLLHELGGCKPSRVSEPWVGSVRDRLREDYRSGVPLGELARALDRHPAHVARAFRAAFGMTAGEYLRRTRVAVAVRLLRDTDTPISQVALATGFADQSHMGRWIRRYVGQTPGAIRSRGTGREPR